MIIRKANRTRNILALVFACIVFTTAFIVYRSSRSILQRDKQFVPQLQNVREQFFKGVHKFDHDNMQSVNDICQYYNTVLHRLTVNALPSTDEATYANLVMHSDLVFPPFVKVQEMRGVKLLYIDAECLLLCAIENLKSMKILYTIKNTDTQKGDTDTYTPPDAIDASVVRRAINFDDDIEKLQWKPNVTLADISRIREQIRNCDTQLKRSFYEISSTYSHYNVCKMITIYSWLSFDTYKHMCYVCMCQDGPLWYLKDTFDMLRLYCLDSVVWLRECAESVKNFQKLGEQLGEKIDSLMQKSEKGRGPWNNLFHNYKQHIDTHMDKLRDVDHLKERINKRIANKRYSYCVTVASYFLCYGKCLCLNNFMLLGNTMINFAALMTQIGCLLQAIDSK